MLIIKLQLLLEAGFEEIVETAIKFVCDLGKAQGTVQGTLAQPTTSSDDASVVQQTIEDLIDICSQQPVPKVSLIHSTFYLSNISGS